MMNGLRQKDAFTKTFEDREDFMSSDLESYSSNELIRSVKDQSDKAKELDA